MSDVKTNTWRVTEKEYKEPSIHWANEQPEEGETYIEQNILPSPQSITVYVKYIFTTFQGIYIYIYTYSQAANDLN